MKQPPTLPSKLLYAARLVITLVPETNKPRAAFTSTLGKDAVSIVRALTSPAATEADKSESYPTSDHEAETTLPSACEVCEAA